MRRVWWLLPVVLVTASVFAADDTPFSSAPEPDPGDRALARELQRMWTIHPEELVTVIASAARREPVSSQSLSLLLAIAHAETSGDVLDISEAGAVGLAQATPAALRQERVPGKLYVTRDYLDGLRAYILKKPLHDVEVIADDVVYEPTDASFQLAKRRLADARALRREGFDDLGFAAGLADDAFFGDVHRDDERNIDRLDELARALDSRDLAVLRALRDRTHDEYRASIARQQAAWKRYQLDLIARRDSFLESRFNMRAAAARKQLGYVAGEMLAEELDVRFSPTKMAQFLVRHLERKAIEAQKLAKPERHEEMTAALYNGGSHNVKRMLSGLITWLPETENYMRKVPATRRRLDDARIAAIVGTLPSAW